MSELPGAWMTSLMQALKLQGCRGEAVVVGQGHSLSEAGARKNVQHDGGHGSIPETSKSKGKEKENYLDVVNEQALATVHVWCFCACRAETVR